MGRGKAFVEETPYLLGALTRLGQGLPALHVFAVPELPYFRCGDFRLRSE